MLHPNLERIRANLRLAVEEIESAISEMEEGPEEQELECRLAEARFFLTEATDFFYKRVKGH